jgi:hypothetical protein
MYRLKLMPLMLHVFLSELRYEEYTFALSIWMPSFLVVFKERTYSKNLDFRKL